ncbi:MAG: threonine synthase [Spirochaetes bacterium]|nr:MAG: threonine synthase [Spirochaetota bacterium]
MRAIRFSSTRALPGSGDSSAVTIEKAIVQGMPRDGGLFVPNHLPPLPPRIFDPEPLRYADLAYLVMAPFFQDWGEESLRRIIESAYSTFFHPEVAPLEHLADLSDPMDTGMEFHLLELFHGQTCAFKDLALSVLGGLLRESLDRLGMKEPVLVLTATSGDTGSAALEGLSGIPGVKVAVIYPHGGTSDIQRLQMTTAAGKDRFVAAIKGNFDDAQGCVKSIFQRASKGEGALASVFLSSANSINIGRLLPQIVYYVAAYRSLKARNALNREAGASPEGLMHVAVPTGNFGDILAAKYAKEMGLPIGTLICASNANKVLADFFATGVYDRRRKLVKTDSPSMDILVSSNLERLLHMAAGEDGARVRSLMEDLSVQGWFEINGKEQHYLSDFTGGWCSDFAAGSTTSTVWETSGVLVDPHTATAVEVALRAVDRLSPKAPIVVVGTASPYKFPKACLEELDPEAAARPGVSDLDHALRVAKLVHGKIPEPIARLAGAKVVHETVLELGEVEAAIACFAAGGLGAE